MILQVKRGPVTLVLTKKRIDNTRESVFEGSDASDVVVATHLVSEDTIKDLGPAVSEEMDSFKAGLILLLLSTAISNKDKNALIELTDWALISYENTRAINRTALVNSAKESWIHRKYLPNSSFVFDQNSAKIDRSLARITRDRIAAYNRQEKKRLSVIMAEGKKQGWNSSKLALEIKRGAGLNSVQQKALYNIENGMRAKEMAPSAIKKKTDAYISKARAYRKDLSARWDAESAVNEGQLQLWNQVAEEEDLKGEPEKGWFAILDNVTGKADRAMDGQWVPLKDKFIDPTLTYAPVNRPPLRGNCRCGMDFRIKEV